MRMRQPQDATGEASIVRASAKSPDSESDGLFGVERLGRSPRPAASWRFAIRECRQFCATRHVATDLRIADLGAPPARTDSTIGLVWALAVVTELHQS